MLNLFGGGKGTAEKGAVKEETRKAWWSLTNGTGEELGTIKDAGYLKSLTAAGRSMIEDFQDSYKGIMTDFSSNICGGNRNVCGDRQNKHLVSVSVQCALTIYKWTGYEFQASPGLYGPMPTGLNAASFEVQTVDGSQVRARITIWAPWEQFFQKNLGLVGAKNVASSNHINF